MLYFWILDPFLDEGSKDIYLNSSFLLQVSSLDNKVFWLSCFHGLFFNCWLVEFFLGGGDSLWLFVVVCLWVLRCGVCFGLFFKCSTLGMKYWNIFACEEQNPSVPNLRWMSQWSVIYLSLQQLGDISVSHQRGSACTGKTAAMAGISSCAWCTCVQVEERTYIWPLNFSLSQSWAFPHVQMVQFFFWAVHLEALTLLFYTAWPWKIKAPKLKNMWEANIDITTVTALTELARAWLSLCSKKKDFLWELYSDVLAVNIWYFACKLGWLALPGVSVYLSEVYMHRGEWLLGNILSSLNIYNN